MPCLNRLMKVGTDFRLNWLLPRPLVPFLIPFAFTEIEDDDDEDNDRLNGASGDHERNNDSIFAELSRGGKFGLEEVDDGASITGQ